MCGPELSVVPFAGRNHHQIDALFTSTAHSKGASAVGVVLSGTCADGCLGVRRLSQAGAIVITQEPITAECSDLVERVAADHLATFTLAPREIGAALVYLAMPALSAAG